MTLPRSGGELYRLHEWLRDQRLTGIITAKAGGTDPFSEAHYGFAAYMADCALLLARRNQDAVSERDLSILKYRGSAFSENRLPFLIGPSGLEVASQNPIGDSHPAARERLSSGVSRLDVMLTGGYFRSSSTLITGVPGTAKSSLAGAFVDAACRRQERALYVSFDERSEETVRNLSSIGLKLQPHIDSGHLRMMSALSLSDSAETQLLRIRAAIREHRATCVAIDPISAFANASSQSMAIGVLARFIHWARTNRITLVCTSLLSSADPQQEAADLGVSTLSDTWIHLAYTQRGGERNRSLTIVKSRGTAHSNQVREVILSKKGIALADVYEVGGEVFMGTLRWEKENTRRDEDLRPQGRSASSASDSRARACRARGPRQSSREPSRAQPTRAARRQARGD
jgi:circadian clock protein KaiC